uniref:AlNc14C454G11748 protein n=1 Tax=Albugo laibachii Nc14 TaxID=890382 RepID=F0X007_9STRA|nr:AlNc14C454G11748 [Albugo laibachii Nc14]|eukprot:CCA27088.1 AlNc14C454G11748 [Albugo laibachii Nc14]
MPEKRQSTIEALHGGMSQDVIEAIKSVISRPENCMAVFDFAGTLIRGSLTSGILYYQLYSSKFAFTPEQFREAFYFAPGDTEECIEKKFGALNKFGNAISTANLF